jgi:hypothetical protein
MRIGIMGPGGMGGGTAALRAVEAHGDLLRLWTSMDGAASARTLRLARLPEPDLKVVGAPVQTANS